MAKLLWALACQRVIVDQQTNTASYIDVIEEMNTPEFPVDAPPFFLGTLWEREDDGESLEMRIRVKVPGGETVASFTPDPAPMELLRYRFNILIEGLKVQQEGQCLLVVDQRKGDRWRRAGVVPIHVQKKDLET